MNFAASDHGLALPATRPSREAIENLPRSGRFRLARKCLTEKCLTPTLAASAGMAGDIDVAKHALSVAKQLHPSLSVDWVEKYHAIVRDKDRATYIEGLRAAGLI